jgi:hypothetical protein
MKKTSTPSNSRLIQFALMVVSLALFVIGAGAPVGGGSGSPGAGG